MTKVEAKYEFTSPFQDSWTGAIDALHSVYGLQAVMLTPDLTGMIVTYDASRLKLTDVDHTLLGAGLAVKRT